uniref:Uncharacterized protein n=1 Tax=Ananas comosus var. bracteatus TaxID=296719 RepID=A0A6V7QV76_ANACO
MNLTKIRTWDLGYQPSSPLLFALETVGLIIFGFAIERVDSILTGQRRPCNMMCVQGAYMTCESTGPTVRTMMVILVASSDRVPNGGIGCRRRISPGRPIIHLDPSSVMPNTPFNIQVSFFAPVFTSLTGCAMFGMIQSSEAKICPLFCMRAKYMTCRSSGHKKLRPACNCCLVEGKGCIIHLLDSHKLECKN